MSIPVDLVQAGHEEQLVLENLLHLYLHDFSELIALDVGNDGRFEYKNLALYWSDPARLPFLARVDGKLAGFVLVRRVSELQRDGDAYDMAEFFVLRGYRRRGIGSALAERVWLRYPGWWQVRVMANNAAAFRFWAAAIESFTGKALDFESLENDGIQWRRFTFNTASNPP